MSGKRLTIYLVALVIAVAIFLFYRNEKNKNMQPTTAPLSPSASNSVKSDNTTSVNTDTSAASPDQSDQADQDFAAQCENGEWVKIADVQGDVTSATGILHWVDADNDAASKQFESYTHYLNGKEKIALINPTIKSADDANNLDLFQGREVEVQGVVKQVSVKEMQVSQVRCTGSETDKNLATSRVAMLGYISSNISSIAPEKAPYQKWTVDSAIILDEKDIYVDYYDTLQDDANSDPNLDTMHRVLLQVSPKDGGSYDLKVLAYYVPGEDEMSLKSGTDKFKNQDETAFPSYTYDSEENSWTRD
ncbi:MAG: hypothetical protein NT170_00095 [Candidatus Moranbacteria bacterium]|nr:hypothetical protein [Candidatus Moranbacteria bacterium]